MAKKVKSEENIEEVQATETEKVVNETVEAEQVEQAEQVQESEVDLLKKALVAKDKEATEYKNDYLRARADCENIRKRKAEDVRYAREDGKLEVITKVLPIGDSLVWALKLPMDDKTREGIDMLLKKYHETLSNLGVTEFSPEEGSDFDPNTAQAIMQMEKDNEDQKENQVHTVFAKGYKLGEKVIRYAQVSVTK